MSIFSSNAQFGNDIAGGFDSWMPGGSFGSVARGAQSGMNQLGQSLRQSIGSWMPKSGTNRGGWGNGAGPQFGQNDFTLNDDGESYAPFGGRSGGGGFSDNRYSSAYNQLGQLQNDIQNGRDGNSGQALDYFGRQEKQQKISELYKNTMNFDGETQRQLAQVQDELAKRKAQEDLRNPRLYNGVANTNEMLQNEARAKWGVGASQTYADGGRIGWGAGNQQGENLREAARRGVPVSNMLQDKGDFDAKVFDQGQSIYNPAAGSAADPFTWIGHNSYHSMGLGAGEGNTNHGAVYGGDFWDPRTGANGYERDQLLGIKDWQWDKFHKNNLSFGGGNYIGDKNYGKLAQGYDFQGPTFGGPSRGPEANPSYDPQGALPGMVQYWRGQGYSPSQIDRLIEKNGGTLPPRAYVPTNGPYGDTQNERQAANDYYGKLVGGGYKPEVSSDYVKQMQKFLENSNSRFSGMQQELRRITNPIYDIPNGGAVGSGVLSTGNDVFEQGDYGQSSTPAPRMSEYQRMRSPYRNLADGFDNGYYNALNDSSFGRGNYRPQSFWRTR